MILILSQIIGISGVALFLLSFQLKRRKHIVLSICISNMLYVIQYLMLGAFSGASTDFLSTVASYFAGKKNSPKLKKYAKPLTVLTLVLIAAVGIFITAAKKDLIELLPIIGALLQTGSLWSDDEQTIRKLCLSGAPFWLIYNFISQAYGAAFGSLLSIISIIISLIRYRKNKREDSR